VLAQEALYPKSKSTLEEEQIMFNTAVSSNSAYKVSTGFARRLLMTVATIALAPVAFAQSSGADKTDPQSFFVLDNPGDPNFNQLLGINDGHAIVGYFGDGTIVPNNGYVLVPKNHYSVENFTNLPSGDVATQTQAIGINTRAFPDIVGFYTDKATGFTHGFLDSNGVQSPVDDPAGSPPNVTTPVQNLLGINNFDKAAGFWTDNNGHEHGFVVELNIQSPSSSTFIEIPPTTFAGAVATQASDITNNDQVCGFFTDANGNNHGFFGFLGQKFFTFNVTIKGVKVTSTSPFGCNDKGEIVGAFTDSNGNVHGFIFADRRFFQFDAPGSSQKPAFGTMGTMINGVNERGDIVGFFSDGTNVNGFVNFAQDPDQDDDQN
jgi:probable HAF family extracellular repeat protein